MPEAERTVLIEAYRAAETILEYGSGGSTILACLLGKRVHAVESDLKWAGDLSGVIGRNFEGDRAVVVPVDIGPTKAWSFPADNSGYEGYSNYPNAVWDRADFRHPDLILIDGRFRVACLMTALQRVRRPTRVLFDDYRERPYYHWVEELAKPVALHGRMAEFRVDRTAIPDTNFARMIAAYADFR
ncbi:MAG: hypothetical protein ABS35_29975 [Kaistia sp. SCN 65-12]|nr:MAG: hypothetical protein ABS35_29975 [Kaistia sp. SCN 65-12]